MSSSSETDPTTNEPVIRPKRRFSNQDMAGEEDAELNSHPKSWQASFSSNLHIQQPPEDHVVEALPSPSHPSASSAASSTFPPQPSPSSSSSSTASSSSSSSSSSSTPGHEKPPRKPSWNPSTEPATGGYNYNPEPQAAPGASAAVGHNIENSIPLSIFPIASDKFAVCFCGLPGRGKTHISRRLARYLEFFHAAPVSVFNVTEYRRNMYGAMMDAEWFDPKNKDAATKRTRCNDAAVADMVQFLHSAPNAIGVLDCTNHTHMRRLGLVNAIRPTGAKVLFIEVSNTDEQFLNENYRTNVLCSPDYAGKGTTESAFLDYRRRVDNYSTVFEPIDERQDHPIESKWSYFKCDHSRHHFVVHSVRGHVPLKIVHFIMNMRTDCHPFYLSRHGQSEYNQIGRIGGDSGLTEHGLAYARKLADFVESHIVRGDVCGAARSPGAAATSGNGSGSGGAAGSGVVNGRGDEIPARLWTSTMRRTRETAQFIGQRTLFIRDKDDPSLEFEWVQMKPRAWHHLDELFAGACDGMTYEEIEAQFPEEFERREKDKLAYRYPRGESYLDVIARLEPIILEMERHREPLLIVAHQGILRIIYAFYMGLSRAQAPFVSVPLNCVVKLTPSAFSCTEQRFVLYTPPKALASDGQDEPSLALAAAAAARAVAEGVSQGVSQGLSNSFAAALAVARGVTKAPDLLSGSRHGHVATAGSGSGAAAAAADGAATAGLGAGGGAAGPYRKSFSVPYNPDDPPSH